MSSITSKPQRSAPYAHTRVHHGMTYSHKTTNPPQRYKKNPTPRSPTEFVNTHRQIELVMLYTFFSNPEHLKLLAPAK